MLLLGCCLISTYVCASSMPRNLLSRDSLEKIYSSKDAPTLKQRKTSIPMREACLFWKYKKNPIGILSFNLIKMYPKTTTHEIIAIRFSFRKKLVKINDKFAAIEINADYIIDYALTTILDLQCDRY